MRDSETPFELLSALARRIDDMALPAPERARQDDSWQAIAFQLDDASMLINMNAVQEVSPQPAVTRLPGVKAWVRGIANVRGEVLAIVDLHEFFELGGNRKPTLNRVIAIAQGEIRLGVVVDKIIGMRQVAVQQVRQQPSEGCPQTLKSCVSGAVLIDGNWMDIFDPSRLMTNENFLNLSTL